MVGIRGAVLAPDSAAQGSARTGTKSLSLELKAEAACTSETSGIGAVNHAQIRPELAGQVGQPALAK